MTTSTMSEAEQLPLTPPRRTIFVGVAGWSVRHPWFAVAGWLALVVMCVVGGNLAGLHRATDAQLTPGESGRAAAMMKSTGLQGRDTESVTEGRVLPSSSLFGPGREIWIEHDGTRYRLRITKRNKLILQK